GRLARNANQKKRTTLLSDHDVSHLELGSLRLALFFSDICYGAPALPSRAISPPARRNPRAVSAHEGNARLRRPDQHQPPSNRALGAVPSSDLAKPAMACYVLLQRKQEQAGERTRRASHPTLNNSPPSA